jgi:hypothetical protein
VEHEQNTGLLGIAIRYGTGRLDCLVHLAGMPSR